jgi:UDP-2,3-diacylglucosamine pyrophosphatase LpxH
VVDPHFDESLLILSDIHLGNDLNDLTPDRERRSTLVDADLTNLLAYYRDKPCTGRRWRLVIAGDFIDFIGMTILPRDGVLDTEPSEEERAHGLGSAADHARLKLRAVAARHPEVLQAVADFVAAGHALTIVHGNHDVEFHWDVVKNELRSLLVDLAGGSCVESGSAERAAGDVASRIDFAPWFYYVGGVAYVEHGHQYDTLCSTQNVIMPVSPLDPRRIARSFSDVLLRWVVRPTRGMPEYGHERMGVLDYVAFAARLGAGGLVRLGLRFCSAVVELFRLRRAYVAGATHPWREEQERRMRAVAVATRVGIEKLRALAALQVPPVTQSIPKIMASVLLDRIAVGVIAAGTLAALALLATRHVWCWAIFAAVGLCWWIAHHHLRAKRRQWFGERLDNDETLAERAGHLARLFPAAFVVMGHTHTPAMVPVAEGAATYINVGSWHEAEAHPEDAFAFRAARTHLVIHPQPGGPAAEFLAWGPDGPKLFVLTQRDS